MLWCGSLSLSPSIAGRRFYGDIRDIHQEHTSFSLQRSELKISLNNPQRNSAPRLQIYFEYLLWFEHSLLPAHCPPYGNLGLAKAAGVETSMWALVASLDKRDKHRHTLLQTLSFAKSFSVVLWKRQQEGQQTLFLIPHLVCGTVLLATENRPKQCLPAVCRET